MKKLNLLQTFNAMKIFHDMYYNQTNSEDIGGLLGGLQLCTDIPNWKNNLTTWDEAAWQD